MPQSRSKKVNESDQEIPQSQNADKPNGIARKSHTTITRHKEDKRSKSTSSLFPFKMIAKLEWTLTNQKKSYRRLYRRAVICRMRDVSQP